jgi:hypothetical protein
LIRTLSIPDATAARALFGPLHRHVALIHESFRRDKVYVVDIRVAGNEVTLESADEAELARAESIFLTLMRHFDRNSDGVIDYVEFYNTLTRHQVAL